MFKRVGAPPKSLYASAPHVADVYSLSCHGADDFADYIKFWRHNGYWLFDSPAIMRALAMEQSISLDGLKLFYYEAHDVQYDEESGTWGSFEPEAHESFTTKVWPPKVRTLEGYDVVTFSVGSAPECSPLSCNSLAGGISTNSHCLLPSLEAAIQAIEAGSFDNSEPGPFRVIAVYSVDDAADDVATILADDI
jgi:hypothetical protein